MPTLQVRDLPQDVYERLCENAKAEHRSIAQQATAILESHLLGRGQEERPRPSQSAGNHLVKQCDPASIEERIACKRRIIESLETMPSIQIPSDIASVAELIAEGRRERDGRFGL